MIEPSRLVVGIADIKVGKAPCLIRTSVGSCIAVCLYDEKRKVGGMLHLMLASSELAGQKEVLKKAKYADTGIPELIEQIRFVDSSQPSDLTAKIFGGAKALKMITQDIGKDNEAAVRAILYQWRIPIKAAKTGGEKGYQIDFDLGCGKVRCQVIGSQAEEF